MFCEKCGTKLPDDGKFCEKCGAPAPGAAGGVATAVADPVPEAVAVGVGAAAVAARPPMSPKKKKILLISILLAVVLIVGIVFLIVWLSSRPTKIVLDDCFTLTYEGCDGYGSVSLQWDDEAVKKADEKIFGDQKSGFWENMNGTAAPKLSIRQFVDVDIVTEKENLSNGDTVTVTFEVFEGFEEEYNIRIKLRNETVTVEDLSPVTKFNPLKDVSFTFNGFNGYGNMTVTVPEGEKAVLGTNYVLRYYAGSSYLNVEVYTADGDYKTEMQFDFDRVSELSNGDVIAVTKDLWSGFEENLARTCGLALDNVPASLTVSGLDELEDFDPLAFYVPSFDGYDGYGSVGEFTSEKTTGVGPMGLSVYYKANSYYLYVYLVNEETGTEYRIDYDLESSSSGLTNGEILNYSYDAYDWYAAELAKEAGLRIKTDDQTVTVSGLAALTDFNPLTYVTHAFSGYNTLGVMSTTVPTEAVTVGDRTVTFSMNVTSYRYRIYVTVDGDYEFYFSADKFADLTNGDTVTFSNNVYYDTLANRYGLKLTAGEAETVTVTGLTAPTDPAVFDHLTVAFEGYEGYGKVAPALGEDVYTVGDYTFKLTLTYTLGGWNSKCNLVVVVADKSGANLFTVEYRGSNFYDIAANGEIMTFTCNKYDHQRIEILREYGIDFPAKKEYTVSGLKKVTNLDLRDNFDFLFSGEDGNISLAVTPKSEFLLEGPYTIRLSVETVSSWWSSEIQLKFSVEETATGTEVANGCYYVTAISGLYEGNEIYVSAHFEQYDIGAATGLVLDDGNALLIVSTK